MAGDKSEPRIALVLGSGGIVGGAFHAGVVKALLDVWQVDARHVDLIVGSSAGSISATLTAAGLHPNDLFRRETQQALSPSGHRLLSRARKHRGPKPDARSAIGRPLAPEMMLQALSKPAEVSLGSGAAGLMPRGAASTDHVAGLIEGLCGDQWPSRPELRICAVHVPSGRRVVFGAEDGARPSEAVAASCAVPAVFAPVTINGEKYLDGGVHSADNLDVVGSDPFDLVVVSSPMGNGRAADLDPTWGALRAVSRWQTERQRRHLTNTAHIEVIRPDAKVLDAMGSDLLNPERRPAVALQAYETAVNRLNRHANPLAQASTSRKD